MNCLREKERKIVMGYCDSITHRKSPENFVCSACPGCTFTGSFSVSISSAGPFAFAE